MTSIRGTDRAMLGVLGGGQLGRMFVHAAQVHGFAVAVLDPDADSPAGSAAQVHLQAAYDDLAALDALARACSAVTTEFENVPAAVLRRLGAARPVAPPSAAVEVCQHRLLEKRCFIDAGVACAPHAEVASLGDTQAPLMAALLPGLLKTASQGYDGKGQVVVQHPADLPAAWKALGAVACVLERRLPLRHELSVIVARGRDGRAVHLPVQQNLHRGGILAVTQVPAPGVDAATAGRAVAQALRLAERLAYVGVLCVEFFVLDDGTLVANEMAPRPHNSGHYSIDACDVSQFDLQVRTLAGLPLVQPRQHSAAVMLNLLGELWLAPAAAGGAQGATSTTCAMTPTAAATASTVSEPSPSPSPSPSHLEQSTTLHPSLPLLPTPTPIDLQPPAADNWQAPDWPSVLCLPGVRLHLYGKWPPRLGRKMGHLTVTAADAATARTVALQAAARLGLPPF